MADRPQFLASVVNWLRAGYPNGVPSGDYIPLVAILRRQLSDDEVREVAATLVNEAVAATPTDTASIQAEDVPEITRIDVGVEINKILDELPSETDLARVRSVLVGAGWPFDDEPLRREPSHQRPDSAG
ncbi:MAG: DUF3349 domain-containing protein [Gordonia sp. (in: high G+C Gram-positive bacteria)]|uniref:DUF3349 domain-containing protein n=1 Tax=Gordonia sp. (in: high G+C Gram-positive bacteria) TaxID=84139 RepID=UPI0039E2646E